MLKSCRTALMRGVAVLLTMSLVLAASTAQAGPVEVFKDLPSNAIVSIATGPIGQISQKVDFYAHELEILPPNQPFNLVEQLQTALGEAAGGPVQIDGTRGLGLAIMNIMDAENSVVMYVPVANPKGVIDAMTQKEDAGQGVWKTPSGGLVSAQGQYLVIGNDQNTLAQAVTMAKGVVLNAVDQTAFGQSDVAVSVNLTSLMPMAQGMISMMAMQNPEIQKYTSLVALLNGAAQRVGEIQGLGLGVQLDDAGVLMSMNFNARPGSVLAGYLSSQTMVSFQDIQNSNHSNLIAAQTAAMDSRMLTDLTNYILDSVAKDTSLQGKVSAEMIATARKSLADMFLIGSSPNQQVSYFLPGDTGSQVPPIGTVIRMKGKADQVMTMYGQLFGAINGIFTGMELPMQFSYRQKAGEINGLSYDEMVMDMSGMVSGQEMPPATLAAMKNSTLFAKVNNDTVITATQPQIIAKVAELAAGAGGSFDPAIGAKMTGKANYFAVLNMKNGINAMVGSMAVSMQGNEQAAGMMGMASMLANMLEGEVALSAVLDNGAIQTRMFMPRPAMKSVVKVGKMAVGAMGAQAMTGQQQPGNSGNGF